MCIEDTPGICPQCNNRIEVEERLELTQQNVDFESMQVVDSNLIEKRIEVCKSLAEHSIRQIDIDTEKAIATFQAERELKRKAIIDACELEIKRSRAIELWRRNHYVYLGNLPNAPVPTQDNERVSAIRLPNFKLTKFKFEFTEVDEATEIDTVWKHFKFETNVAAVGVGHTNIMLYAAGVILQANMDDPRMCFKPWEKTVSITGQPFMFCDNYFDTFFLTDVLNPVFVYRLSLGDQDFERMRYSKTNPVRTIQNGFQKFVLPTSPATFVNYEKETFFSLSKRVYDGPFICGSKGVMCFHSPENTQQWTVGYHTHRLTRKPLNTDGGFIRAIDWNDSSSGQKAWCAYIETERTLVIQCNKDIVRTIDLPPSVNLTNIRVRLMPQTAIVLHEHDGNTLKVYIHLLSLPPESRAS